MTNNLDIKPRLSEKSYGQSQILNTYVFDVPYSSNKQNIANAISEQFEVSVTNVNITVTKGKNKRTFINRRGKFVRGNRSDIKKAYVTIKHGDKLPIFAQEEEAEAKAEKAAEKAAKKTKKVEK